MVEEDNVDYEIQSRIERLEKLLRRQPYLLLNISIKKNPDQVQNWLKLVDLYEKAGNVDLAYDTIEKAIEKINPEKAEGKFSDLWIQYSVLLQKEGQIRRCNEVLHQASQVPFRMMEDALSIWRRWVEMLLEERFYEDALRVIKHVLFRRKHDLDPKTKSID